MRAPLNRSAAMVLGVAACTDPLPSPSTVDVLRILALPADTPEITAGTAVSVRATWFDPQAPRAVFWRWRVCDPGVADDPRVCARPSGVTEIAAGTADSVSIPAAALGPASPPADRTWIVYALACPVAPAVLDTVENRLKCPAGQGSEAYRRIVVRAAPPLNANPAIDAWSLTAGGETTALGDGTSVALALAPCDGNCGAITVAVSPAAGSAETYAGGAESLMGSVYVTNGSVDPPRLVNDPNATTPMSFRWTPASLGAGSTVARIWCVLRDQRGGETVRAATVTGTAR